MFSDRLSGFPDRFEQPSSSCKPFSSISWEQDVFLSSCTPITSCVMSGRPDLSRIGFRVGRFDWKLLDSCQLLHVERDLNPLLFSIRVSKKSLVEAKVTCILFRI